MYDLTRIDVNYHPEIQPRHVLRWFLAIGIYTARAWAKKTGCVPHTNQEFKSKTVAYKKCDVRHLSLFNGFACGRVCFASQSWSRSSKHQKKSQNYRHSHVIMLAPSIWSIKILLFCRVSSGILHAGSFHDLGRWTGWTGRDTTENRGLLDCEGHLGRWSCCTTVLKASTVPRSFL